LSAGALPSGVPGAVRIHRLASLFWFLLAAAWFLIASLVGASIANELASRDWSGLISCSICLFLLLVGYWGMGYAFQRQRTPLKSMGLIRRATALREFGVGAALGWGGMVLCVLPIALLGGMTITFWTGSRQWGLLLIDLVTLLVTALVEEIGFRGYPFQRLIEASGPALATLVMSATFGLIHLGNPDSTLRSTAVTMLAGWLCALAYLRTRALWLPWGLHFAWNASMGLLFGLPVSGLRKFSPVVATNSHGPIWLTGNGYGPEGGLVAIFVLLVSLIVLLRVTQDYAYEYAQPVIVAGGLPVDIDAAAKRQHEVAMASPAEAAVPNLVQILSVGSLVGEPPSEPSKFERKATNSE
jgi:membrane protease YdiL (CAAX protease family)